MFKKTLRQSPFFTIGAPFLVLMVAGTYGLSVFTQGKYTIKDREQKQPVPSSSPQFEIRLSKQEEIDLEQELKKIEKEIDLDNYNIVRIKRPE